MVQTMEKELLVVCHLTLTDRNGRHLHTVDVSGDTTDEVISGRAKIWDSLQRDYPDAYIFTRWDYK